MNLKNNIEVLEEMPTKENRAQYLTNRYHNMYNTNLGRRSWHTSNERNPFKLTERLLAHYVGKPFDDFFSDLSERCKHHDILKQYKYFFMCLLTFEHDPDYNWGRYKYYVNKNGIILRKKVKLSKGKRKKQRTPKEWYEEEDVLKKEKREIPEIVYIFNNKNNESNEEDKRCCT